MAKRRKRATARKTKSRIAKKRAKPVKKPVRRTAAKKAKKAAAKTRRKRTTPRAQIKQRKRTPTPVVEDTVVDIIDEPIPGVVRVTEVEEVSVAVPDSEQDEEEDE
jgi:hypothetical protein